MKVFMKTSSVLFVCHVVFSNKHLPQILVLKRPLSPYRGCCFSLIGAYGIFNFTMKFYTNFTISLIVRVGMDPGAVGSD